MSLNGNAAWALHVRACEMGGASDDVDAARQQLGLRGQAGPSVGADGGQRHDVASAEHAALTAALAAGAGRVRGALTTMREQHGSVGALLAQVEDHVGAAASAQLAAVAGLVHRLDAFVTSWAAFDVWAANFGGASAETFQGIVHPMPPYHAVIAPAPAACGGGAWLWVTVPAHLVPALVHCRALQVLTPGASWISNPDV